MMESWPVSVREKMGSFKGLSDTLNSEPLKCKTFALLDN